MKKGLAIAGAFFLLVLLCAGLGVLVDGPDTVPDMPLPAEQALYILPAEITAGITAADTQAEHQRLVTAWATAIQPDISTDLPVSDRNGRPLGAGVYVQMVYEAFPPEGVRG